MTRGFTEVTRGFHGGRRRRRERLRVPLWYLREPPRRASV